METTSFPRFALDPDLPLMPVNNMFDNGESQTRTAHLPGTSLVHPVKTLEQAGDTLPWDSDPGIADDEFLHVTMFHFTYLNGTPVRGIFHRIIQEVDQNLPDPVFIGPDRRGSQFHRETEILFSQAGLEGLTHLFH